MESAPPFAKKREGWATQMSGLGLDNHSRARCSLTRSLFKGLDRRRFVFFHVENRVELGDLEQIVHLLREVQ